MECIPGGRNLCTDTKINAQFTFPNGQECNKIFFKPKRFIFLRLHFISFLCQLQFWLEKKET